MMTPEEIKKALPYARPFLFVDEIETVDSEGITGSYRFREDEVFYPGHFVGNPVTPGVILTECMAQIGLVCLGIYLKNADTRLDHPGQIAFSSANVDFYQPVRPGERVKVKSEKKYYRLGKLKCHVKMTNEKNLLVCEGELSGMIK